MSKSYEDALFHVMILWVPDTDMMLKKILVVFQQYFII